MEEAATDEEGALRFLTQMTTPQLADRAKTEDLRKTLADQLDSVRRLQPPTPTSHWSVLPHYRGIEMAQLVIVNLTTPDQRSLAEGLLQEVPRLRRDPEVFKDVMDVRATRLPITSVIANLADPKDAGLNKALARVKRAWAKN